MKYSLPICLFAMVAALSGCVTAHECSTRLDVRDRVDNRQMPDAYILKVVSRSPEKQGHWWLAERDSHAAMTPTNVQVLLLPAETPLHQEGTNLALLGPYAYGPSASWEYWVVRPGYDPQRFYDAHLERAYKQGRALEVSLSRRTPGSKYSDEKVIDAARRIASIGDLLPADEPAVGGMLHVIARQLRDVRENSWKPADRDEADDMLTAISSLQETYAPPAQPLLTALPDDTPAPAADASDTPEAVEIDVPELTPVATEELSPPPALADPVETPAEEPTAEDAPTTQPSAEHDAPVPVEVEIEVPVAPAPNEPNASVQPVPTELPTIEDTEDTVIPKLAEPGDE
jgi:hypothetical protein